MAIRTKARAGESAEQLMRRFKKLCEKEGLTKDIKRQAYYEKPSERRRRSLRKSIKRAMMPLGGGPAGRGGPAGGPKGKFAPRGPGGRGPGGPKGRFGGPRPPMNRPR